MKMCAQARNIGTNTAIAVDFGGSGFNLQVNQPLEILNYDFAVWPLLLYAIKCKANIETDLPLTKEFLFNASILQSILHHHLKLDPIQILLNEQVRSAATQTAKSILPFSGGIDSCFSLLYNHFELGRTVDAAIFVKGLDLWEENECQLAFTNCKKILSLTDTVPIFVTTTVREHFVTSLGWKLHSDFVLAGLLHLFDHQYRYGFISGEGDGGLLDVGQCFQTPFMNERLFFLFSNDAMLIQNFEGANHTKVQKVEFISRFDEVQRCLRVCWKSKKHDNCGVCDKCIMTQLYFIAVSGCIPPCFPIHVNEDILLKLFQRIKACKAMDPDSPAIILPKEFAYIFRMADKKHMSHRLLDLAKIEIENCNRRIFACL